MSYRQYESPSPTTELTITADKVLTNSDNPRLFIQRFTLTTTYRQQRRADDTTADDTPADDTFYHSPSSRHRKEAGAGQTSITTYPGKKFSRNTPNSSTEIPDPQVGLPAQHNTAQHSTAQVYTFAFKPLPSSSIPKLSLRL